MNLTLHNRLGESLDCSFSTGSRLNHLDDWIVILGHGVTGDKDRPVITATANALNLVGFDTLRFSFTGNGHSQGDFRDATISKESGDLGSIIDVLSKTYSNIAYVGHSMGGAVGVLQTAKDSRINALVSLAGMIDTQTFAETEFGDVTPDNGCMWGNEGYPLSTSYMRDLCQTIQNLTPLAECITVPWLLVHGTADDVVLPKDTHTVQTLKGDDVKVVMIDGADHSFSESSHTTLMTRTVTEWLISQAKTTTSS